jgi:hypothetical protein
MGVAFHESSIGTSTAQQYPQTGFSAQCIAVVETGSLTRAAQRLVPVAGVLLRPLCAMARLAIGTCRDESESAVWGQWRGGVPCGD